MTIFTLSGPSCTGKSTLAKRVANSLDDLMVVTSVTTREPRPDERPGEDYHYIGFEEFKQLELEGKLAEVTKYNGYWYGITLAELERIQEQASDAIAVTTASGVLHLRDHCRVIPIHIDASDESILARIGGRHDPEEIKSARLATVEREREDCRAVALYTVKNAYLDAAVDELVEIIKEERR